MPVMRCPHCGAENFTMEGWEDLDHCSSCGKPLAESRRVPASITKLEYRIGGSALSGSRARDGEAEEKRRPA